MHLAAWLRQAQALFFFPPQDNNLQNLFSISSTLQKVI